MQIVGSGWGECSNDLPSGGKAALSSLMGLGLIEDFLPFFPFESLGFLFLVCIVSLQSDLGLGT